MPDRLFQIMAHFHGGKEDQKLIVSFCYEITESGVLFYRFSIQVDLPRNQGVIY